jgi:16S rRNA (guanine966-N2)-methyltransferase
VRVIAGQQRGRKLTAPPGMRTRPVTARVRASIFSRLASRDAIVGRRVLDLFAGSGSLGLEALSRGACEVVFVERGRNASLAIARNLRNLGLEDRARSIKADFHEALQELAVAGEHFGLIFIDAPFGADATGEVLALITRLGLLAPEGFAVTRQFHRAAAPVLDEVKCVNVAKVGDHRIAMYQRLTLPEPA